ncbi:MAG: phenylalanine--tRNA ligase subunit beta, partial [Pseudomonadota bacterium]|nr:phenylalanine--tRNA ligase subunit beta [Pseudomonadota bacterium]
GLDQIVFVFELNTQCISVRDLPNYSPIPKFPSVNRDLSITVDVDTPADKVRQVIVESGGTILNTIELFDVYQGAELEKSKKSLSYGLTLKGTSRNLTEQDIEKVMEEILDSLKNKLGSKLRNK